MQLVLASYNAGAGNILKAQKLSGEKKHWLEIKNHLIKVTGKNSKETIKYVSVITDFAVIIEDYKQD
jgi:CRISPR/Cas system CMR-associated protein Cmr5 small subunit